MQDRTTAPRPAAVKLRMAAAKLGYYGEHVVAAWLAEVVAPEQDKVEAEAAERRRLVEETGLPADNEYIDHAAREAAEKAAEEGGSDHG